MEDLLNLVLESVKEVAEDQNIQSLIDATEDTRLFGENLNSLETAFLVAELESRIFDKLGIEITLADERAMSQKTSPFRSVKTLAQYANTLIEEAKV